MAKINMTMSGITVPTNMIGQTVTYHGVSVKVTKTEQDSVFGILPVWRVLEADTDTTVEVVLPPPIVEAPKHSCEIIPFMR